MTLLRRSWLRTLAYGLGLYAVVTVATVATENLHLVPSVLMLGALLIQGVETSDVNVLLAWLMVTSVLVVLFNLIADVLYAVLDPRIRYG